MSLDLSFFSFVAAVVLFVGIAIWYLSSSTKPADRRREKREAKRISHQPWDGAGGRANR